MTRQLLLTADGSHTVELEPGGETFHSRHGAIQESEHVYIREGWNRVPITPGHTLSVLEMGMGTGLNLLLLYRQARAAGIPVRYEALELFPLEEELYSALNYCDCLQEPALAPLFQSVHTSNWNELVVLEKGLELVKRKISLTEFQPAHRYQLILFDAFSPNNQEELWSTTQFRKLYDALDPGGILVTYCSKTVIRRALEAAGFTVAKVQGPWGKREMVRATKLV